VRFPAPLFEGDTVARDDRGAFGAGVGVARRRRARRVPAPRVQTGRALVAECRRTAFMRRRPAAPTVKV